MERTESFNYYSPKSTDPPPPWPGLPATDRRYAYSRQSSFNNDPRTPRPFLSRTVSTIDIPDSSYDPVFDDQTPTLSSLFSVVRSGNKPMKRLLLMISLNVAYSSTELAIGLFSGRVGLVSDAFHLTFGCGLLTFSLFAMAASRQKPDRVYTYGYKRLEVLSAFTNATAVSFVHVVLIGCGSTSCLHSR